MASGTTPPRRAFRWPGLGGLVLHHLRMGSVTLFLLRSLLPYPDLLRRRRMRKSARRLIVSALWPEDHATSLDIAQLALLRLLWLQRETHRAARKGLADATVNGHLFLPIRGHRFSPLVAIVSPHWRPSNRPAIRELSRVIRSGA